MNTHRREHKVCVCKYKFIGKQEAVLSKTNTVIGVYSALFLRPIVAGPPARSFCWSAGVLSSFLSVWFICMSLCFLGVCFCVSLVASLAFSTAVSVLGCCFFFFFSFSLPTPALPVNKKKKRN